MKFLVFILLSFFALYLSLNPSLISPRDGISAKPIVILLYFLTLYWRPIWALFVAFFLGFLYEINLSVLTGTYPFLFTSMVFVLSEIEKKIFKFKFNSLVLLGSFIFFFGLVQSLIEARNAKIIFYKIFTDLIPEVIFNIFIGFVILFFINKRK
ncbi:MAG: rod shape-determining protein MreD [candidate division WOR-3 bacterium]